MEFSAKHLFQFVKITGCIQDREPFHCRDSSLELLRFLKSNNEAQLSCKYAIKSRENLSYCIIAQNHIEYPHRESANHNINTWLPATNQECQPKRTYNPLPVSCSQFHSSSPVSHQSTGLLRPCTTTGWRFVWIRIISCAISNISEAIFKVCWVCFQFCNLLGTVYHKGNLTFTSDGNSVISPVGNRVSVFDLKK